MKYILLSAILFLGALHAVQADDHGYILTLKDLDQRMTMTMIFDNYQDPILNKKACIQRIIESETAIAKERWKGKYSITCTRQ